MIEPVGVEPAHLVLEVAARGAQRRELLAGGFELAAELLPRQQAAAAAQRMIAEIHGEAVGDHDQPVPAFEAPQRPGQSMQHRHDHRWSARAPANRAAGPRSSSIRSSWLYLARRSERDIEPVLIWPQLVATARSAIVLSSVSPERCDITQRKPASC